MEGSRAGSRLGGMLPALLRPKSGDPEKGKASASPSRGVTMTGEEAPTAAGAAFSRVLLRLRLLSALLWAALPLAVLLQGLLPGQGPTCAGGVRDYFYVLVLALLGAYWYLEDRTWEDTRFLATHGEVTVLRTFGVFRQRKWLLLLGALEIINLYNDLTFPFLAYHCGGDLTHKWAEILGRQLGTGSPLLSALRWARLWGLSAMVTGLTVVLGVASSWRLLTARFSEAWEGQRSRHQYARMVTVDYVDEGVERMPGEDCVLLAHLAEHAGLPSVARLSQELGWQRRFVFDAKEQLGGALASARAREGVVFGKLKRDAVQEHELRDRGEQERVDAGVARNLWSFMFSKVLVGNVAQLWMQVVFLQLAFDRLGGEAKGKLVARIAVSALHVSMRTYFKVTACDCLTLALATAAAITTVWACSHAAFAFVCPSHVWHLFGGCIAA